MYRSNYDKPEIVGLLDIGSAKICCAIVERTWPAGYGAPPAVRVLGIAHAASRPAWSSISTRP